MSDSIANIFNFSDEQITAVLPPRQKNATILNEMGWQYWFLIGVSVLSLPLYIMIIVTILVRKPSVTANNNIMSTRRLNDAFYNLILSQGIADVLAILFYFCFNVLQTLPSLDSFFLENKNWMAPLGYNNIYFFLVLRTNGIMLFSIQRYLVFVKDITNETYKLQRLYVIFFIHWAPSFLIMLPVTANFDKTFNENNSATIVSPIQLGLSSGIACVTLIINALISGACYIAVVNSIYKRSSKKIVMIYQFRKQREFRLSVQVFFQIFAMVNCLVYHSIQFYIFLTKPEDLRSLNHIREYYPIITCELSFVNPWTFIFINNRLRLELYILLGIRKNTISLQMNQAFIERKSSILNNSGPRRGSSVVQISAINLPAIVR